MNRRKAKKRKNNTYLLCSKYIYSYIPYGMYGLKCNQAADATGLLRLMRRMDGNCRKKSGKRQTVKKSCRFLQLFCVSAVKRTFSP